MKLIPWAPGGVLENVVSLVGFERLCYMVADDPALAGEVFDGVGARLVLISQAQRALAAGIARRAEYVELTNDPRFTMAFAEAMLMP